MEKNTIKKIVVTTTTAEQIVHILEEQADCVAFCPTGKDQCLFVAMSPKTLEDLLREPSIKELLTTPVEKLRLTYEIVALARG